MDLKVRAGLVGFGEVNTPREVLERKISAAFTEVKTLGWDINYAGLVTDDAEYSQADSAVGILNNKEYDLIILCVAGWIPTHAVIRVIESFRDIPMIVWGLTGWMENGRLVTTADQAGTTALCFTMRELGFRLRYVYSTINKNSPLKKIESFGRAAMAVSRLRDIRIGTMGYRDMLLYGTMFDGLTLRREIGPEVEPFEMLEIVRAAEEANASDVNKIVDYCLSHWHFIKPADHSLLEKGARYYLALDKKSKERHFEAMTLIDVDGMKKLEGFPPAMVFMLLADLTGVCTTPENDVMGNVTQLLVRALTGQDAHYMEFYEFFENSVLIGVPDYIPSSASDGEVHVLPTAFGLLSESLLNVSKVRGGRVTLVRLLQSGGRFKLHVALGEAKQPAPWEECGWTPPAPQLPSLEVFLDCKVDEFAQKISSQHTIIAYGDITDSLTQWAKLLNIEII